MPPERVVGEQLATMVLAEADGTTLPTLTLGSDSKAERDGAVASGMEHGMAASYDRLDAVLEGA